MFKVGCDIKLVVKEWDDFEKFIFSKIIEDVCYYDFDFLIDIKIFEQKYLDLKDCKCVLDK